MRSHIALTVELLMLDFATLSHLLERKLFAVSEMFRQIQSRHLSLCLLIPTVEIPIIQLSILYV